MVRKIFTAVVLAAALTLIGTYADATDYHQPHTYPTVAVESAIGSVSWGFSFSAGRHGGARHYRHGHRHHGRHGYHYGYRVYRRHNFYGPSRNFYDSDGSYSYYEQRYYEDHSYRHGRGGHFRKGGGYYRHRPAHGRGFGHRRH